MNRNQHGRYGEKIIASFAGPGFQQSPTTQVRRIKAAPRRMTGKPPQVLYHIGHEREEFLGHTEPEHLT